MIKTTEQEPKERTKGKEESKVIMVVDRYGIILQSMNYTVAHLSDTPTSHADVQAKDFESNSNTYHPNLHQALIELSKRLLEDKLKVACKDKPLELKELAKLIKEHHEYFVNLVKGM